jgi:hypothetical protein
MNGGAMLKARTAIVDNVDNIAAKIEELAAGLTDVQHSVIPRGYEWLISVIGFDDTRPEFLVDIPPGPVNQIVAEQTGRSRDNMQNQNKKHRK